MWSVKPLKDSWELSAPASSACLVARVRTSAILSLFLPASARRAKATGILGSSREIAAMATDPCGSSRRSSREMPSRSLSGLEASSIFWIKSSLKSFIAGSFQSCPYRLPWNASRRFLTSFNLTRKIVESGRTRSGGVAACARGADSPIPPKNPIHPIRAKRRITRFAVCIRKHSIGSRHPRLTGGGRVVWIWPPTPWPGSINQAQATSLGHCRR